MFSEKQVYPKIVEAQIEKNRNHNIIEGKNKVIKRKYLIRVNLRKVYIILEIRMH